MRPSSIGAVWPEIGGEGLIEQPRAAGRGVVEAAGPYEEPTGHAGALVLHRGGTADPQSDGSAAGFQSKVFHLHQHLSKADFRPFLTGRQLVARGADNHEMTKKLGALLRAKTTQSRRSGSFYVFI